MVSRNLDIPIDRIEAFCRKWRVRELSLFGSVLRDDFRPDSDVDLVEKEGLRNLFRRRTILDTREVIYAT